MRKILLAATAALALGAGIQAASAAPTINGTPSNTTAGQIATDFANAGILSGTWTLQSPIPFFASSVTGGGTLDLRSSTYGDSFGWAPDGTDTPLHTIFGNAAAAGATAAIAPGVNFDFYFHTDGSGCSDVSLGCDPAGSVFSDGSKSAANLGQVDMAIYEDTQGDYAFFFDDGGPSGLNLNTCYWNQDLWKYVCQPKDDNDYNDLVVTFVPTPTTKSVPEPVTLSLFGAGLAGVFAARRKRKSA